jgi:gephyrin
MVQSSMESLRIGVLTCSDRCFKGETSDASGPAVCDYLEQNLSSLKTKSIDFVSKTLPDERVDIAELLKDWSDNQQLHLIFTTGGTGFAPRDVTPEATKDILDKEAPGLVVAMISASLAVTPHAMLSRPAAGIRGKTLIINLPGSPKAAKENIAAVLPALPHAIALIQDIPKASTSQSHQATPSVTSQV